MKDYEEKVAIDQTMFWPMLTLYWKDFFSVTANVKPYGTLFVLQRVNRVGTRSF